MKNLKIATWDMKEFSLEQVFYHKEEKALALLDFLDYEKPDVVALQNVDRKIARMVNQKLREFPEMGYSFDRLKSDEDYTILDKLVDNEKNPLIIKNSFFTMADEPVNVSGLFINKVYLTEEHTHDKFCLVNTTFEDLGIDYNFDRLANSINANEFDNTPMIVTGRIDFGPCSREMHLLRTEAFDKNNLKIIGCINKKNKYNYMMINGFNVYSCDSYDDYEVSRMCKPLVATLKMK